MLWWLRAHTLTQCVAYVMGQCACPGAGMLVCCLSGIVSAFASAVAPMHLYLCLCPSQSCSVIHLLHAAPAMSTCSYRQRQNESRTYAAGFSLLQAPPCNHVDVSCTSQCLLMLGLLRSQQRPPAVTSLALCCCCPKGYSQDENMLLCSHFNHRSQPAMTMDSAPCADRTEQGER